MKGDIIKTDVFEVNLDHESTEEILEKEKESNGSFEATEYLRYCVINTSLMLIGLTAKNARPMKPYLGHTAYTVSCVKELIMRQSLKFDVEFDDGKFKVEGCQSSYL